MEKDGEKTVSVSVYFFVCVLAAVALVPARPGRAADVIQFPARSAQAAGGSFDAGDMVMLRRMHVTWAPIEAGGPVVEPDMIFGNADAAETAMRLTGLPKAEAVKKLRALCVRLPQFITKARIEPGEYTVPAEFRESFADPAHGLNSEGKFTLTRQHLILLQQGLRWENRRDDGDEEFWPVQGINFKRPYGDYTYYEYEMAAILGEPYTVDPATGDNVDDPAKDAALEKLHMELLGALQVVLLYGEMPAGK